MHKPLAGRRILVTRASGQASALADALVAEGAEVVSVPAIEIAPPATWDALDQALKSLHTFDWLLFTSANAVLATARRASQLRLPLSPPKIAVIGPATAAAVHALGWKVDLVPEAYVAESLAKALLPHASGSRMLLIRAEQARDILPQTLRAAGADLHIAEAYRTMIPESSIERLRKLFPHDPRVIRSPEIDAITFTSASTATNLAALLERGGVGLPRTVQLASIGPITSKTMRALKLEPSIEAQESTIPALVRAIVTHFQ